MKRKRYIIHYLISLLFPLTLLTFGGEPESSDIIQPDQRQWFNSLSLNSRVRFETVSQEGLVRAEALTLRNRLGWTGDVSQGFSFLLELEHTEALDSKQYDPWPGAQGPTGPAVIADPRNFEINRAQMLYKSVDENLTLSPYGQSERN